MEFVKRKKAVLLLADGSLFEGKAVGNEGTAVGEICFNTGMTGYQEIFTDPSYFGQLMVATNAHIGNYGVNGEEQESDSIKITGLICRNFSYNHSRPAANGTLEDYFKKQNFFAISDVDTRALVRHIRSKGAMNAVISTNTDPEYLQEQLNKIPSMEGLELASSVSVKEAYTVGDENATYRIAALDLDVMKKILFIIFIFCFGHVSAQDPNTKRTITQVNNTTQVNNSGSVTVFNDKEIEGNRFLFPNWQNQGQIYYKGAVLSVDNINFDISTNSFSQMKKQDSIFVFDNSKIDSVKVNNRLLKRNNTGKFSEILSEGKKLNLIKSYDVEIMEGMYSPVYGKQKTYRYKIVTSYYAVQNGIPRKVYLNKKNFTELFGSETSVMEKYIEDNKLSYKDESDMIRACNYFNTI